MRGRFIAAAQYIRGLAKGLASKIEIYEKTPALTMTKSGQDWVVGTPHGKITTPKIILAVNGHAESFGFFKGRLMHVFTYASMTEAMNDDQIKALGGQKRRALPLLIQWAVRCGKSAALAGTICHQKPLVF